MLDGTRLFRERSFDIVNQNVFHLYHPVVPFAYLACALALTMACMHPVFACLSLAGALPCSVVCRGLRATLLSLRWVIPLCLIVSAANPFFVASGSTELFRIGPRAVYAEALVYGLCSGAVFAAVFLWFASYSACLDSERSMMLFGNRLPTITLMVSQVLRLVPQFVSRGHAVLSAQAATSAAAPLTKRDKTAGRLRVVNVLMGWGMEDSLSRSDAMRVRGYHCGIARTSYQCFRFGPADKCLAAVVLALAGISAACTVSVLSGFRFYPVITGASPWWLFLPYGLLMAAPPLLNAADYLRWKVRTLH